MKQTMYSQCYVDTLHSRIRDLEDTISPKKIEIISERESCVINIPYHPDDETLCMKEVINCLSHALEGADLLSPSENPEWELLKEKIHSAFLFAEILERLIFKKD